MSEQEATTVVDTTTDNAVPSVPATDAPATDAAATGDRRPRRGGRDDRSGLDL